MSSALTLSRATTSFFSFSFRLCAINRFGLHIGPQNWGVELFYSACSSRLASGLPFGWRPAPLQAREKYDIGMTWHSIAMGKSGSQNLIILGFFFRRWQFGERRIATGKELTRLDEPLRYPFCRKVDGLCTITTILGRRA